MGLTSAELRIDEPQLRVADTDGRAALEAVLGLDAVRARARLRFGPGRTCEPVARLLDRAIVQAEQAGLSPERLIVASGRVQAAEDIVRVRRKAHGTADWISSPTSRVRISLQPAGLHASARAGALAPPGADPDRPADDDVAGASAGRDSAGRDGAGRDGAGRDGAGRDGAGRDGAMDERAGPVREALFEVIDPDLGVNIVDLGFVRAIGVQDRTAVITMTLTSAACPLTGIMEDQVAAGLAPVAGIDDFRIDWVWLPAWRPADITDSGRDQLRAIGFTF
jgi:metal-sulfur cluster biosynthetic enzyme